MRSWLAGCLLVLLAACGSTGTPLEARYIDAAWSEGQYPTTEAGNDASLERMTTVIRNVGRGDAMDPASIPTLCRLSMQNASDMTRANALRSAWELGQQLPVEPYRVDTLDSESFNQRAIRLDALLEGQDAGPGEDAVSLAHWLGEFRFSPERVELALSLSEAVSSRSVVHAGEPVGDAFAQHAGPSLRHALTLVTMYAMDDKSPWVRLEAARAARHMDPEAAMVLLGAAMQRESDAQVVFMGLESLEAMGPQLDPSRVRPILTPLLNSHDVAVRRRARDVAAALSDVS